MGIVFRKSKKIAPGVRVNLTQAGTSFSFGGKGMRYTVGNKRSYFSFKIPGTNLRWRTSFSNTPSVKRKKSTSAFNRKILDNVHASDGNYKHDYSKEKNDLLKVNWGCSSLIIGIFLFFGFLLGGNPSWAFGSLILFGGLYWWMVIRPQRKK